METEIIDLTKNDCENAAKPERATQNHKDVFEEIVCEEGPPHRPVAPSSPESSNSDDEWDLLIPASQRLCPMAWATLKHRVSGATPKRLSKPPAKMVMTQPFLPTAKRKIISPTRKVSVVWS